jgi:hypothetical protein
MALTERLAIIIDANGQGAIKEFNRVGSSAEKELGRTEDRTKKLGASLTQVGAVMIGVGAVLVGGAYKAAQAFEAEQMAHLRLQNTIDKMPMLVGANTKAFLEQASALQKVTKYGDDTTVSAQAMLGTFNMTQDQILELTPLVQDYASKFGTDLVDASKQVGKAVAGQIGALKKNGVTIDETAYKTDRFAAVTQALRQQAGGFAEVEGKTFSGQLTIMKNNLGDLAEVVGGGAVGAFNSMIGPVKSVSEVLQGMPPAIGNVVGGFAAFGGVGLIVAGAASMAIGSLMRMKDNFTAAYDGAKRFASFMQAQFAGNMARTAAVLGIVGLAAAALAVTFKFLADAAKRQAAAELRGLGTDADQTRLALQELGRSGKFIGPLADEAQSVRAALEQLRDVEMDKDAWSGFGPLAGWLQDIAGEGDEASNALSELDSQLVALYSVSVTDAQAAFELLKQRLLDAGWSMQEIENAVPGFVAAQNSGRDATGETSEATRLLTEALGEQAAALNALFSPVFAAIDSQQKLGEAQRTAAQAGSDLAAAQAEFDRVLGDSTSTDAQKNEATLRLLDASRNLEAADYDLIKATVSAEGALLKMAEAEAAGGTGAAQFRDQLNLWVAQGLITEEQARKMQVKFDEVRVAAENAAGNYDVTLSSNAEDVIASLGRLNSKLDTLRSFGGRINIVPPEQRAKGGPVTSRSPYLVGEEGPELFIPSASGQIVSHGKTKGMLSGAGSGTPVAPMLSAGGGGGDTYNITINGMVGKDKRDILDFLARELPAAAANHSRSFG